MYEYPIAPPSSPLPEMLSNLSMLLPLHHDEIHWQTDSISNGEAWWLRAEELENYGEPATFSASYEPGYINSVALQISIKTNNLNAFSLKRTWKEFSEVHTFILAVDGQRVDLPTRSIDPEWCVIRKKDGLWQSDSTPPSGNDKTSASEGPIVRVLQEPFLIVTGTASNPETTAKWQQSAQALADQWHQLTGKNATVLKDSACTPEALAGHHLILLGGPRENLLVNSLLDDHPEFLRDIYLHARAAEEPADTSGPPDLCCMTLYPAGLYSSNKLALIVLADIPADIAEAWKPLFTPLATQGDYLLFSPHEATPRTVGWCTSMWDISN